MYVASLTTLLENGKASHDWLGGFFPPFEQGVRLNTTS